MRILIVDDETHCREGLRESLAREGHAVETAQDGREASGKIAAGHFQVAIIDLDLPRVPGNSLSAWDVARICRDSSASMTIILMAAEAPRPGEAGGLRVAEILEKPISPSHLKRLVGELSAATGVSAVLEAGAP